ncbi:MAG: PilZ domain-containing protein [Calditrichaeota bacterium]|nr:PilZ domain-containing protein [Calditrichota bacterium]
MLTKRKAKRDIVAIPLSVFEESADEPIGHLMNVTPNGIMLRSSRPIKTQSLFRLLVVLPGKLFGPRHVTLEAKSIWCRREDDFHTYHAGFQLRNLDAKTQKSVESLIATLRRQN